MDRASQELAAYAGHAPARSALGAEAGDPPTQLVRWVRGLERWGKPAVVAGALGAATPAARSWSHDWRHEALVLVSTWLTDPEPAREEAARALIRRLPRSEVNSKRAGPGVLDAALALESLLEQLLVSGSRTAPAKKVCQHALASLEAQGEQDAAGVLRAEAEQAVLRLALGQPTELPAAPAGKPAPLEDPDPRIRRDAVATLAADLDPRAAVQLLPLLTDEDRAVQEVAATALIQLKVKRGVIGPASKLLNADSPTTRIAALRIVAALGGKPQRARVRKLLSDPVAQVRAHAARAAGRLGDTDSVPLLDDLRGDEDRGVREAVAEALGRLKS